MGWKAPSPWVAVANWRRQVTVVQVDEKTPPTSYNAELTLSPQTVSYALRAPAIGALP